MTQLLREYRCSPLPTILGPLVVQIPLFILMSVVIRQGAEPPTFFSSELLPWYSPSEFDATRFADHRAILAEKGMDAETLSLLSQKAGPTLADRDPTMIAPIAIGMLTMLNVELGGYSRRLASGDALGKTATPQDENQKQDVKGKEPSTSSIDEVPEEPFRTRVITNTLRTASIIFVPIAMQAPGVSTVI